MNAHDPIDICFLSQFGAAIPGIVSAPEGGAEFLSRCKSAVLQVLRVVEGLPRTHWVWIPGYANMHVNVARFDDYLNFTLREAPTDEVCLWAGIARDLSIGRGWGAAQFRVLQEAAGVRADCVLYAAIVLQCYEGSHPMGLRRFLEELGLLEEAVPTMQRILAMEDSYVEALRIDGFSRHDAAIALSAALPDAAA